MMKTNNRTNDLICNRDLGEVKGGQNQQHVICAKITCGERERESGRGSEKNLQFVDYREVNLGIGALSCGIGLAISVRVVGEDLSVELCLWDGDVQFLVLSRTEQLHHQDKFGASRTTVEGLWNVEISPGPCA